MTPMRSFLTLFGVIDLLLIVSISLTLGWNALLNTQVGAFSALLIAIGSYWGYRNMIDRKAKQLEEAIIHDPDELDKIDDPYELFEEEHEEVASSGEEKNHEKSAKELYSDEKARLKQTSSVKALSKSFGAVIAPFRLISYLLLILGFVGLNETGRLELLPYLLGISVMPLSVTIAAFKARKVD